MGAEQLLWWWVCQGRHQLTERDWRDPNSNWFSHPLALWSWSQWVGAQNFIFLTYKCAIMTITLKNGCEDMNVCVWSAQQSVWLVNLLIYYFIDIGLVQSSNHFQPNIANSLVLWGCWWMFKWRKLTLLLMEISCTQNPKAPQSTWNSNFSSLLWEVLQEF